MNIGDRIRNLRKENGFTQEELADRLGLKKSAIAKYENGRVENIKRTTILKMATILGCSPNYLIDESDEAENKEPTQANATNAGVRVPVLGRVVAGIPLEAIMEDSDDWEEIPEALSRRGEFFALKVKGDSMAPRICEGDVLIVLRQSDADSGDIVIVLINGHEAVCKKLVKFGKDGISLVSFNSSYEPLTYTNEEIRSMPVQIIGKVVENRQKY